MTALLLALAASLSSGGRDKNGWAEGVEQTRQGTSGEISTGRFAALAEQAVGSH